jgi:PAS domain-containing protein
LTKTSVEWLMRFAVVRSPPAWAALGVSLAATAAAIATRGAIVGLATATSFSATSFPAFIIATLYGGAAWGWATLVLAVALGSLTPTSFPNGISAGGVDLTFALSGALTVLAAATLRDTLLRLEETRRVQDETKHALDRSEARLRMAQDAAGVGLWDYDLATDKSVWSPAVYRSLGLDPSGPATMDELLKAVHPDDRDKMRRRATGRDGRLDAVEYRVIWPDGQVRWLLSRGEVLRDPETGAVVGAAR